MDFNERLNGVSIYNCDLEKNELNVWNSTDICFDSSPQFHLNSISMLNSSCCIPMNSTLPVSQYFSDSNDALNPQSPPELIHSPPYSPNINSFPTLSLTQPTPIFSATGTHQNSSTNYAPILPNGVPQLDIATTKQGTIHKRKKNPSREANRAALLAAAASDPQLAAKLENEEDKRRRNTAASARFRIKKKLREEALERTTKEMSIKANLLENKVKELEMEVKWLQGLLIDKDPTFANLVPPFKRQCK